MNYPIITLHNGKEIAVKRYHPWVFSGAIKIKPENLENGAIVSVISAKQEFLGVGFFQDSSIAIRLISFNQEEINQAFWNQKIRLAIHKRAVLGLIDNKETNAFRLFFGEGDGIPGLVIDFYNGTAVMQAHALGIHYQREQITLALRNELKDKLKAVYYKSDNTLHQDSETQHGYLWGTPETTDVVENGLIYSINWESGQKTGYFLDQRDNRTLLGQYAKGKTVLDTFCHTGGFSLNALKHGAKKVYSVDASKLAIEMVKKNSLNNGFEQSNHHAEVADVMEFFKENHEKFDVIVLDPPAFAKSQKVRHNAIMAYKRLNEEALKRINSGGILFTFSCSQVVDKNLFYSAVTSAAISSGRKVSVLHRLSQPADHPVNIFHPEGEYLKGLVLFVE
jgi:23S rRNA (cytosine1962-C5)-methyltransferase